MDIDSCYRIGYVTKRHGIKGEIKIHLESELPQKKLESIFVELDNRLIPFFIEEISVHDTTGIFKLEDVDSFEQATSLLHKGVYLPKTMQPRNTSKKPLGEEIAGFEIVCNDEIIGVVKDINDFALNPLIVATRAGKELLIPINEQFILEINTEERVVYVELPDGFLDI